MDTVNLHFKDGRTVQDVIGENALRLIFQNENGETLHVFLMGDGGDYYEVDEIETAPRGPFARYSEMKKGSEEP